MRQVFNAAPWIPPAEDKSICDLFSTYGRVQKINKNSLLKCGADENKLFYLKKGLCLYIVNYSVGKTNILAVLPPGRSLCNISCISRNKVNVTTYAKKGSEILTMNPSILRKYLKNNPEAAETQMKLVIETEESFLEGMIVNSTLSHEERLKTFYKSLIHSYGSSLENDRLEIPVKLSNVELGMVISANRVTVSRIKNRWSQAGMLTAIGSKIFLDRSLFDSIYDWKDQQL